MQMYRRTNAEIPENWSLLVSLFVDQSALDIHKYFSRHAPGWQGKGRDGIVSMATFVFKGREGKQEKVRKKQQEETVSLLAAALWGPGPFFPRERGQGQGCHKLRGLFSPEISGADCCNYCR